MCFNRGVLPWHATHLGHGQGDAEMSITRICMICALCQVPERSNERVLDGHVTRIGISLNTKIYFLKPEGKKTFVT